MSNETITNTQVSVIDLTPMEDVFGLKIVLRPKGAKGDSREVSAETAANPIIQRVKAHGWVTLTPTSPAVTTPSIPPPPAGPTAEELAAVAKAAADAAAAEMEAEAKLAEAQAAEHVAAAALEAAKEAEALAAKTAEETKAAEVAEAALVPTETSTSSEMPNPANKPQRAKGSTRQ